VPVVASAATITEVSFLRRERAGFRWALSRIDIAPVTEGLAFAVADLLVNAGLSGHQHALDAIVCATALELPNPRIIFTSDPRDIKKLIGTEAAIVALH